MLITPALEKLLLTGAAEFRTTTKAGGSVIGIQCPPGKLMLLRQIRFHYFSQYDSGGSTEEYFKRSVWQLSVFERQQQRDSLTLFYRNIPDSSAVGDTPLLHSKKDLDKQEVWKLFRTDICANLTYVPSPKDWAGTTPGTVSADTSERAERLGFVTGSTINVAAINMSAGEDFLPASQARPLAGSGPGGDEFRTFVTPARQAISPFVNQGAAPFNYPIVTFVYLVINADAYSRLINNL